MSIIRSRLLVFLPSFLRALFTMEVEHSVEPHFMDEEAITNRWNETLDKIIVIMKEGVNL